MWRLDTKRKPKPKNVAPKNVAAGKVRTHASKMLRTVACCSPALLANIVPATPEERMCVVDTGAEGNAARRDQDANEVPHSGPYNGRSWFERLRIDDRRNGVGRIAKAVNELEA
jgi:hypothetical protein